MERAAELQSFIDAAHRAFDQYVIDPEGKRVVQSVFGRLAGSVGRLTGESASKLPVCSHLAAALAVDVSPRLKEVMETFRAIEPLVSWRRRPDDQGTASSGYVDGHGNAVVVGPGGLEERSDVWLGFSLLAPGIRYPDHQHAPEEVYLVFSDGQFKQADDDWFTPGPGGTFYNHPLIWHVMKAGQTPLFACWILQPGPDGARHQSETAGIS